MEKRFGILATVVLSVLLPQAARADLPGSGLSGDPTVDEGVVYDVALTTAGDVILCESTAPSCDTTISTSEWSDVLVFFNSSTGPFVADDTNDANQYYVFSDDDTGGTYGGLANFLANYNGLSANATAIYENPTGPTDYSGFEINSPETAPVPEPNSSIFLALALGLMSIWLRSKASRRRNWLKS